MTTERTFKTPNMPKEVAQKATPATLDQVKCPVCEHSYSHTMQNGSVGLVRPCKHLIAHLGPCGWEKAPSKTVNLTSGYYAAKAFAQLSSNGIVTHIVSGDDDHDWLLWQSPSTTALTVNQPHAA